MKRKTEKAKPAKPAKALSERVELAGVKPATMKLVERGPESYFLYRSSRKIGTARVEPDGAWTARFETAEGTWNASGDSAPDLLRSVGSFLLATEARALAGRDVKDANPELRIKGRKTPEEALSLKFAERAREARMAEVDALLAALRQRIKPV